MRAILAVHKDPGQASQCPDKRDESFCTPAIQDEADAAHDGNEHEDEAKDLPPALYTTPMGRLILGHLDDTIRTAR